MLQFHTDPKMAKIGLKWSKMTHLAPAKNIKTCLLKEIGNRMDFVITKSQKIGEIEK